MEHKLQFILRFQHAKKSFGIDLPLHMSRAFLPNSQHPRACSVIVTSQSLVLPRPLGLHSTYAMALVFAMRPSLTYLVAAFQKLLLVLLFIFVS